jgi:hypothetical protein
MDAVMRFMWLVCGQAFATDRNSFGLTPGFTARCGDEEWFKNGVCSL